jgi:ABC-2 type transport system permease protein
MKTILNLTWKELVHLYRDRVLLVFLIIAPMLQLILISQSTGAGIKNEKLAVWDQDQSSLSQQLLTSLNNTVEFKIAYRASSFEELRELINQGQATVGVIIPPHFSRDAARPDIGANVPVIVDGTNAIVASSILTAMDGAVGDLTLHFLSASSPAQLPGGVDLKIDAAFNPALNSRWTTLPAALAFITYQVVLVVAAVSFVRERELGTMEQLAVTPIHRLELLLGKGLMVALIGLANFFLLILILTLFFQIPMRGDILLLAALGLLFIVAQIGVGMLISLVSTSQQQAVLLVFLLAMTEITFSGLLVPTSNMPMAMQVLADFSPLQHFTAIVRGVFLKAATLDTLATHVAALTLLAVGSIGISWNMFSRIEW